MKDVLIEFYNYHVNSVLALVDHIKTQDFDLENQEDLKPILEILNHVFFADKYWFSILRKEQGDILESNYLLLEFERTFKDLHTNFMDYLINLEDISGELNFINRAGNRMVNTYSEIILTVVNHGTYHRGNISILLRNIGKRGKSSDYAFYLRNIRNIN
jgi:uncharacterized damage-inducible protein DinB